MVDMKGNLPETTTPTLKARWSTSGSEAYHVHANDGIGQEIKDINGLTVAWTVLPEMAHRIVRMLNADG